MSQSSTSSQYRIKWEKQTTFDCEICLATNTRQLLELPCGHNLCLTCLHMICAHSSLSCPFCRCRLSTWLRRNPDYSKLVIKRQTEKKSKKRKQKQTSNVVQQQPKRHRESSKMKPTLDEHGNILEDWLLAKRIHDEEHEEFRYNYGRITRTMTKKIKIF